MTRSMMWVAAAVVAATPALASAQALDHLQCYQMKDALSLSATVDLSSPAFGLESGCKVGKARYFCIPTHKTVNSAVEKSTGASITLLPVTGPDAGTRICYKLKCPTAVIPDQSVSDQFGNRTISKFKASYVCTPAVAGTYTRFVDNGDGTVIDNFTGLQWEKKTSAWLSGDNYADPHDVDNLYTWCNPMPGLFCATGDPADGTAFTSFLAQLNDCVSTDGITVTGGFAGHCDWRVPTSVELQTILLEPYPCTAAGAAANPCIDPIFGPTPLGNASATTSATHSDDVWDVEFRFPNQGRVVEVGPKAGNDYYRAVRGGR